MVDLTAFNQAWNTKLNTLDGKKARFESTWSALLDCLGGKNPDPKEVQKKLDALPYKTLVKKHGLQGCIQAIVNAFPDLDYTKVVTFRPTLPNHPYTTSHNFSQSSFRYTSPHFHCHAEICCITATNRNCRLGFIQICNNRIQKHLYHGGRGEIENGWRFTHPPPLSDSAGTGDQPWYYFGTGNNCNNPTAGFITPRTPNHVYTRELDDNFNNVGLDLRAQVGPNMVNSPSLKRVVRSQEFTAWLALENNSEYHLLKKLAYRFDFTLNVTIASSSLTVNPVSNNRITTNTDCLRTDKLPQIALNGSLCNAVDQFYWA